MLGDCAYCYLRSGNVYLLAVGVGGSGEGRGGEGRARRGRVLGDCTWRSASNDPPALDASPAIPPRPILPRPLNVTHNQTSTQHAGHAPQLQRHDGLPIHVKRERPLLLLLGVCVCVRVCARAHLLARRLCIWCRPPPHPPSAPPHTPSALPPHPHTLCAPPRCCMYSLWSWCAPTPMASSQRRWSKPTLCSSTSCWTRCWIMGSRRWGAGWGGGWGGWARASELWGGGGGGGGAWRRGSGAAHARPPPPPPPPARPPTH